MTGSIASCGLGGVKGFVGETNEILGLSFHPKVVATPMLMVGSLWVAVVHDGGCFNHGSNALGGDPGIGGVFVGQEDEANPPRPYLPTNLEPDAAVIKTPHLFEDYVAGLMSVGRRNFLSRQHPSAGSRAASYGWSSECTCVENSHDVAAVVEFGDGIDTGDGFQFRETGDVLRGVVSEAARERYSSEAAKQTDPTSQSRRDLDLGCNWAISKAISPKARMQINKDRAPHVARTTPEVSI